MTRREYRELQIRYCIFDEEIETALDVINNLLETRADELEADEPTAYNSIQDLRRAAYEVFCLQEYIQTIIEEGECRG